MTLSGLYNCVASNDRMVLTYFKVLLQHLCGGTLIRRIDLQADISNAKQRPV